MPDMNSNINHADQLPQQAVVYTPLPRHSTVMSKANVLMGGLFLAALGGLYLIHATSSPNTAEGRTMEVDKKLVDFLKEVRSKGPAKQDLFDTRQFDSAPRQIAAGQLVDINPFVFTPAENEIEEALEQERLEKEKQQNPEDKNIIIKQEQDAAMARVKALKIQSILTGTDKETSAALIEGELYYLGENILDWEIIEIDATQVRLKWRELTYVLALE